MPPLMKGAGRKRTIAILALAGFAALGMTSAASGDEKRPVLTMRASHQLRPESTQAITSASADVAKKKHKKKPPAVTSSASVAFAAGSSQAATANCTGKTHISGGGYSVAPNFVPTGGITGSGLRSTTGITNPVGGSAWTASSSAWANPAASGQLTAYARCESNSLGTLAVALSGSATVAPGQLNTAVLNCPPGTHVLSGGYAGPGLGTFTYNLQSKRFFFLQSQRTGAGQWTVTVGNNPNSPAAATISFYALCERNKKGLALSEISTAAPITDAQRSTADASCPGKTHVVSGGFLLSPIPAGSGSIPTAEIDEFQPISKTSWHLGLHELEPFSTAPGSTVQTFAYCKKDTLPKKKKK
jgi:hypothetical protein